jgi:hypothetical protein
MMMYSWVPSQEEYISLEGCGWHKGLTNATKASPYSPVNFHRKGPVRFSTMGFLSRQKLRLYTKLGTHIHNLIRRSQE